ncbi:type III pantothenate kinase [Thalassotalea sediminis]|uniref:type III pantothenate kinase n=1 Tax=Thalassotalea sediminis TaxID=1759089 RepID=UPI0025730C40|nr:type III pantothenate kinase [Thalassotalea sediminis]
MKLLIDIGNTRLKYALYSNSQLSTIKVIEVDRLEKQLALCPLDRIEECIISSVKDGEVLQHVVTCCTRHGIKTQILQSPSKYAGLVNSYAKPNALGIDRWLAMLGAKHFYPNQAVIVVDAGTATTLDCVDQFGQHLGGWIIPGIALQAASLFDNADRVIGEQQTVTEVNLGQSTSMAVSQGTVVATIGLIEQGIKFIARSGLSAQLILTGGNGNYLSQFIEHEHCVKPTLIFDGMSQYC